MNPATTIHRRFDIFVSAPSSKTTAEFTLDRTIKKITGLLLTSDRDDLLYHRGSQRVELDGREIFPPEYESKLLLTGVGLRPNDRHYKIDLEPGNGLLKVEFYDNENPNTSFAPYRVSVYVEAEK